MLEYGHFLEKVYEMRLFKPKIELLSPAWLA